MRLLFLLCLSMIRAAKGHGAMAIPPTRNAHDRFLPQFRNASFPSFPGYGCNCGSPTGKGCADGRKENTREALDGQPCLWFSQGCSIGCPACDNVTQHSMGKSLCAAPAAHPTLPKWAWTMNRWAVEGSVNDTYRFHPWRAPGTAPVADACGMAGGSPSIGGGAAVFSSTPFAKQGDLGSHVLPRSAPQVTWKAGGVVEVAWGIRANHGGGYQYRLCPASEPLTEACFQQTPLKFVGKQKLRYVDGSETAPFEPTLVSEGVVPAGAAWMMNPVPRIDFDSVNSGQPQAWKECRPGEQTYDTSFPMSLACRQFEPAACKERTRMHGMPWAPIPGKPYPTGDVQGECSGDFVSALIVDHVEVPRTLPPGEYVLGWRWDCEETAQVWSSCADVAVVAGAELDYAASR